MRDNLPPSPAVASFCRPPPLSPHIPPRLSSGTNPMTPTAFCALQQYVIPATKVSVGGLGRGGGQLLGEECRAPVRHSLTSLLPCYRGRVCCIGVDGGGRSTFFRITNRSSFNSPPQQKAMPPKKMAALMTPFSDLPNARKPMRSAYKHKRDARGGTPDGPPAQEIGPPACV